MLQHFSAAYRRWLAGRLHRCRSSNALACLRRAGHATCDSDAPKDNLDWLLPAQSSS